MDNPLVVLAETINEDRNGGEQVCVVLEVYDNGDGIPDGIYTNISIESICYGSHSACITVNSCDIDSLIKACVSLRERLEKFKGENTL